MYVFNGFAMEGIAPGKIALNTVQRQWLRVEIDESLEVKPYKFDMATSMLNVVALSVEFSKKPRQTSNTLNSDSLSLFFIHQFAKTPLTIGQLILFNYENHNLYVSVDKLETVSLNGTSDQTNIGILGGNTVIRWQTKPNSFIVLEGNSVLNENNLDNFGYQSIISPNWDFNEMGIGGLDAEFSNLFRRTFTSRIFPPSICKQMGLKHVRGILLHGPPGTGKTLIARQIGTMLNARPPKIVNGPSILDKYVGESEANIRKLFVEAETDEKKLGENSPLHIIIFDEIDAICKARGSTTGGSGVQDTVVNQILTKMDGVEQLNNILVIGMTNRPDMIDEALLRPGRFEVKVEIALPDEAGRLQILSIHTSKMKNSNKLAKDVNLEELAKKTKNFSGAEIEGLCRAAAFTAMYQMINPTEKTILDPAKIDNLHVKRDDFLWALEHDVKPAFGKSEEDFNYYAPRGIMNWGECVSHALDMGDKAIVTVKDIDVETYRPLALMIEGAPKTGKTALAVEIARRSDFPCIKIVTSHRMIGFTEMAKCAAAKKIFDDAAKSPLSVVIVDNIEGLIEYNPVGPRFSNFMVQAIKDLITQPLKSGHRMLILATTSCKDALDEQRLTEVFAWNIHVNMLSKPEHVKRILYEDSRFSDEEIVKIQEHIKSQKFAIGIKHLIDLIDLVNKDANRVRSFTVNFDETAVCSF